MTGRHLLRVPVDPNTKKAQVSLSGTVTANASDSVPYGVMGNYPGTTSGGYYQTTNGPTGTDARGTIGATASIDSRDVTIRCPDIEDSSGSGGPNGRNGDGSITTDSAVSPPLNQPGGNTSWTASPTLYAVATGFSNAMFAWGLSGDGSLSSATSPQTILSVSFPPSASDRALNKQSATQINVSDSDGATAANTFTVRWHYPKENTNLVFSGTPFWQPAELKHTLAVGYINGSATGVFGYSTYNDFFPTASSELFNFGTNVPNPIWATVVAAIGFGAAQIQPTETTVNPDFNQCWGEPLSTGVPEPRDPALMDQYQMNPVLMVRYQAQTWEYEQYGQKGYLGLAREGMNHFMGNVREAGEFTKIVLPPAGGG